MPNIEQTYEAFSTAIILDHNYPITYLTFTQKNHYNTINRAPQYILWRDVEEQKDSNCNVEKWWNSKWRDKGGRM